MRREGAGCTVLSVAGGAQGKFLSTGYHRVDLFGRTRPLTQIAVDRYFNTVGSKEGWTPSTFVSSRANRHKDDAATSQQRAEAYMDDEDLADAAEAQQLQTSQAFAGLGASAETGLRTGGLMGLFRAEGDTKGLQLLRRMGWKDGQGIGPKIRRNARLGIGGDPAEKTYLFAPDDARMIQFIRKTDRKGLGHQGGTRIQGLSKNGDDASDRETDEDADGGSKGSVVSLFAPENRKKAKAERGSMGVGILNDTGSDDEDPYEMGPQIRYNRVMGGDRKKKKKAKAAANPLLKSAPVFVPKTARAGSGLRRCHDGRLPLDGFVLAKVVEDLTTLLSQYAPPSIPEGWKSSKNPAADDATSTSNYTSTADAARASTLNPRSRAALLGEKALPGKSVFDFLSSSARDKLATASGNQSLPPGLGELPAGQAPLSDEERRQALWDQVPKLDQPTAAAALSRSATGPYADDEAKRARYKAYLAAQANPSMPNIPTKPPGVADADFIKEANEFYNCARIFKPMTGFMASRFTTSKTVLNPSSTTNISHDGNGKTELVSHPAKPTDPAEDAAKMGMFGHLTRSVQDFYPTRLLCKRFNVKPPVHSRPDYEPDGASRSTAMENPSTSSYAAAIGVQNLAALPPIPADTLSSAAASHSPVQQQPQQQPQQQMSEVNPDKNDAVEGTAANADVLRAIFGDSDSE